MTYINTILVTGGTTGLGYETALLLARENPKSLIIISSRSDNLSAAKTINTTLHQANTIFLPLDLMSFDSIRNGVKTLAASGYPPIQILLLNAGIQFPGELELTDSGIEKTFATNHLGHALLFFLLRPHLALDARLVVTSSGTHDPAQKSGIPFPLYTTAEELAHPSAATKNIPGRQRYSTSKLCNVYFTYALARRFQKEGQGKTVVAFDPGLMPKTGLSRNAGRALRFAAEHVLPRMMWLARTLVSENIHTPRESGENLVAVAMLKGDEAESGIYFEGRKKIGSSTDSYDEVKQEDLWGWTLKNVSVDKGEWERFESF